MIKNGYVTELLELLGYDLVIHSKKLYIVNGEGDYCPINQEKDHYRFSYEKDGIRYLIQFNDSLMKVSNNVGESMVITEQEMSYVEKPEDSKDNTAFVSLSPGFVNLYHKKNTDEGSLETGYKIYRNFGRTNESIVLRNNGSFYRNSTIEDVDGIPTAKNKIRKYNSEGSIFCEMSDTELLNVGIDEYTIDRVSSNPEVHILLEKVDSMLPGIVNHYGEVNPAFGRIIDAIDKKKTI